MTLNTEIQDANYTLQELKDLMKVGELPVSTGGKPNIKRIGDLQESNTSPDTDIDFDIIDHNDIKSMQSSNSTSSSTQSKSDNSNQSYQTKSGFLTKLGHQKSFFGYDSWKRRYFVLKDNVLIYKKTENHSDSDAIAKLYLTSSCEVNLYKRGTRAWADRYDSSYSNGEAWQGSIDRDNCIELRIKAAGSSIASRTFYLEAETITDARDWCDILENNIAVLNKIEQDKRKSKQLAILTKATTRGQEESRNSLTGSTQINFMMQNPEILRRRYLDILAENDHQVLAFYRLGLDYEFENDELLSTLSNFYARLNP